MKNLYVLIGNGNSIGIITKINEYRKQIGQPLLQVDLTNLFYYGDAFYYPGTTEPFLTESHCPYLWKLGARPKMDSAQANTIISQIMTCGNVYALAKYQEEIVSTNNFNNDIGTILNMSFVPEYVQGDVINQLYFAAYGEFSSYIRYLMIYYNNQISDDDLIHIELPLIDYLKKHFHEYQNIIFNSYNYDILMERLLFLNYLPFTLGCFQTRKFKILFYKPHGSISFFYKELFLPNEQYEIPYDELAFQQKITLSDFNISYVFGDFYPMHNGMVPPYGEAERYEISYYQKIRNTILRWAKNSNPSDVYFIIGSSYGSFDRFELDRINTRFNDLMDVTYINPRPNPEFEAVLSSLFINYKQAPDFTI